MGYPRAEEGPEVRSKRVRHADEGPNRRVDGAFFEPLPASPIDSGCPGRFLLGEPGVNAGLLHAATNLRRDVIEPVRGAHEAQQKPTCLDPTTAL